MSFVRKYLIPLVLLWLAFCSVGLCLHHLCAALPLNQYGWVDIVGYDSEGYISRFLLPIGLVEVHFRHPWLAVATFPVTTIGMIVSYRVGYAIGAQVVICCFALYSVLTFALLAQIMRKSGVERLPRLAALLLWLSFAHVWILGGITETFCVSMAILVGALLMAVEDVRDIRAWLGVSVLAGCVTITNGVKPLAVWLVAMGGWQVVRNLRLRARIHVACACVCALLLVCGAVVTKWIFIDQMSVGTGICELVKGFSPYFSSTLSPAQRLWYVWNALWCEPMMLHGAIIGKDGITQSYQTFVPHLIGATVLLLCVWSAVRNFHRPVVRAALTMVSFDVLIHVIIGWGTAEGQLYCGHWFWVIPVLVSLLPRKVAFLTLALAVLIAVVNICLIVGCRAG